MDARACDPLEPHFSVEDLAERWKLDTSTVRRMFQDQAGVFRIGRDGRRDGKRDYITLRIPRSTVERVYRERYR